MEVTYVGLPQSGLPFVTPNDEGFHNLAASIPLDPFAAKEEVPSEAVVVLNQSSQAVVAMSALWRWMDQEGRSSQQATSNLYSLSQLAPPTEDANPTSIWFQPFLPGSKRLITLHGIFGDNSDVLPPQAKPSGFVGGRAGSNRGGGPPVKQLLEVRLDWVIFASGLCVGPGQMGLRESLGSLASEQRRIASGAANLLRNGARLGEVFELLRPAARHSFRSIGGPGDVRLMHMLASFGRMALNQLIEADEEHREELIRWFEAQSGATRVESNLHG